ncbi:MAG: glycosyltransferase family 9 protein [Chloroflexaceae bacterium]|nr:glycosyltransferase family 9 protein [Chloroflexaceae bacterium]
MRRILVMRLDNIGDVLMTGPALRAIKAALPHTHLTLMASPAGSQAAALLPWVDAVLTWRVLWQDMGSLPFDPAREWHLIETLRAGQFDAAIIFTSFSQSPHPAAVVCKLADIPLCIGQSKETAGALLDIELAAPPDELHQVERNLRLVEALGCPVDDRSLTISIPEAARQSLASKRWTYGITPDAPYAVLNPWTSCAARTYNSSRFAKAARLLGAATGLPVVVVGTEKDRERSAALLEAIGSTAFDMVGQTTLPELAALIDEAQLLLTNNTATMHIADATRTPQVVLFAGTELAVQWQPRHTPTRLLTRPTWCSPCYLFTCPYQQECLDISPATVMAAASALLGNGTSPHLRGIS